MSAPPERADLVVVGAGPAGTAAAIAAARRGLRVTLVDRSRFPRDKCCGDGLTTGALQRLEQLGLRPSEVRSWQPVEAARVRNADGRTATFRLPGGATYAATARRADLDAALVALAAEAGATVHEGHAVVGLEPVRSGGVECTLDDGSLLRSWYVVAADGMWSPLRKLTGAADAGYLGEWHALRQYLSGTGPEARDLWVWFEDDLRPGYVWSFPLPDGGVNVGFGLPRDAGSTMGRMKQLWPDLLARPHIARVLGPDAVAEGPVRSWPIPARVADSSLSAGGGRVLFAGDAARASDVMTGEGIGQALETGMMAGAVVAAWGPDDPLGAAGAYRGWVRRGMAWDDRVSQSFSRVLRSPRRGDAWFDVADHGRRSRRWFADWMFEAYPRAALATPWRWRRGLLHNAGAWRERAER